MPLHVTLQLYTNCIKFALGVKSQIFNCLRELVNYMRVHTDMYDIAL